MPGPSNTIDLHANLLRVAGQGVLVRGAPGRGKSRLSLELLAAGEKLVADDVVRIVAREGCLIGQGLTSTPSLAIRGAGIIDVAAIFGKAALAPAELRLDWVIDLDPAPPSRLPLPARAGILGIDLPCLQLVGGQQNVALIQAVCRSGATALQAWQRWQPEVIDGQGT